MSESKFTKKSPHPWFDAAAEWGKTHNSFHEVKNGTDEWFQWRDYFIRLNWVPWIVRQVEAGERESFTAPARWPGMFGISFKPADTVLNWPPPRKRQFNDYDRDVMRRRFAELVAELRSRLVMNRPQRKPWQAPTDDELRAIYGTRQTVGAAE